MESGSGGFDAAVCEKEFKGPVSDFQGVVSGPLPCAVAPVEVVCRSGAVGGSAFRPFSAGRGSVCAVGEALGETSKLGSHEKDGFLSKVPGLAVGIEGGVRSALGQGGVSGAETAHVTAVESESLIGLLEVTASDAVCAANAASAAVARPTAGESKGIIGSFLLSESDFPSLNSSSLGSLSSARARRVARSAATASARVCLSSSFPAVSAAVAHAHTSILHDACSTSRSDTGGAKGPTGRTSANPAEDLRPVSDLEAGVNFRPAAQLPGQVAGSLPGRQPGTGTRKERRGAVTPSLHPEVPDTQFVSPGRGLGIRQSMDWTKVCETALSGIWVLKGNARARMLPANLFTTFGWNGGSRVHTRLPGSRQGTTVCVHTSMDMEQQSDHKLITPSGMGLLVCGAGSHPLVTLVCKRECANGGEPEPVRWSRITHSLAQR